jgi:hydrogenase maturation protease
VETAKRIVVLGVGNPLMADEGIGPFLCSEMEKQAQKYPDADFIDIGTAGFPILHKLAGRKKAVIIDCAKMGTVAGTIKKFDMHDVDSVKKLSHFSLHEADILQILKMAQQIGQLPDKVTIFGIEPELIEPSRQLSNLLKGKIQEYITLISEEIFV